MDLDIAIPAAVKDIFGVVALVFLRIVWLVALTPLFGGESAPRRFKTAIAILLALCIAGMAYKPGAAGADIGEFGLFAVKETLIGLVLAIFVRILFDFVSAVGNLTDLVRGSTQSLVYDPFAKAQQSPLALLYLSFTLCVFFTIGGHRMTIRAIGSSFVSAPIGPGIPERFLGDEGMRAMLSLVAELFISSIQLAAPVIVTLFLVDLMLGVTNRVAQQIQVFFLGMTFKGMIGLALVISTVGYTLDFLLDQSFDRIIGFFGG